MARLFVIAGPPASGKTTLINLLKNPYPNWRFITDDFFNFLPLSLKKKPKELKKNLTKDIKINIHQDLIRNTIIENGILNSCYYHYFLSTKTGYQFFEKVLNKYKKITPVIFYIDTKPEISFRRQNESFLKYLAEENINQEKEINRYLTLYQRTLYDLYQLYEKYLEKIPFQKIIIKNSYISLDEFIRQSFIEFQKIVLE